MQMWLKLAAKISYEKARMMPMCSRGCLYQIIIFEVCIRYSILGGDAHSVTSR